MDYGDGLSIRPAPIAGHQEHVNSVERRQYRAVGQVNNAISAVKILALFVVTNVELRDYSSWKDKVNMGHNRKSCCCESAEAIFS
jgi:hypothetical protein